MDLPIQMDLERTDKSCIHQTTRSDPDVYTARPSGHSTGTGCNAAPSPHHATALGTEYSGKPLKTPFAANVDI